MKGKNIWLFIIVLILIITIGGVIYYKYKTSEEKLVLKKTEGLTIVPTLQDEITEDSAWCATFQLIWNDLKQEIVKQDIVFNPQEKMAENLNKEEFTKEMISEEYYYKIYGLKTLELKEKIKNGIKEKFDQTSDVIEDINWEKGELDNPNNNNERRYILYSMLFREFQFPESFDKLPNGVFGDKYTDVKYFGINDNTKKSVKNNVNILFYNSKDDFAIKLNTKQNDEIIFYKTKEGNNFKTIYSNMLEKQKQYNGISTLSESDRVKIPYIKFSEKREYTELQNKIFPTNNENYSIGEIIKAIQTIQFELNESGGKVKSEAIIDVNLKSAALIENEIKYLYLDDTFTIFIKEKDKEIPYFASIISNIKKFQ